MFASFFATGASITAPAPILARLRIHPDSRALPLFLAALSARPDCRPGERIVAGKPYVYDADTANLFTAYEARANAPADLSGLTEDELHALHTAAGAIWSDTCEMDDQLVERVCDERERREAARAAA